MLAFTTAATPETEGVPEDGILSFDIVRNGSAIGTHTYRFDLYDGRTEVRIKTEIDYRLLLIPIYRFEHESREVWENGRLSLLESNTNENGTPVKLEVFRDEDLLMVMGEDGEMRPESAHAGRGGRAQLDAPPVPLMVHSLCSRARGGSPTPQVQG